MKKLIVLLAFVPTVVFGQTNAPVTVTNSTSSQIVGDIKKIGTDLWNSLKAANFDNGYNVEPFGLYHKGDFGGGLALTTANTNGFNAGFALATIHDSSSKKFQFYDASLSISLGKAVTIPIINKSAYLYVESGPAFNLANPTTVLEQSIAGSKLYFLNNKLSVGGGIGHNSEWSSDVLYIVHFGYTF